MTPIRQQNPPGPLKLLGLREKTGKNTDFLILLKKTDFLVAHFVTSCVICFVSRARLTYYTYELVRTQLVSAPLRLSVYNNPSYQNSNSKDKLGSCLDPS